MRAIETTEDLDGAVAICLPDGTLIVAETGDREQTAANARQALLAVERKNVSDPDAMRKSMDR